MIRINLLPVKQLTAEINRRRELTIGGVVLALTAILLVGLYLYQSRQLAALEKELVELRQEIEVLNVKAKQVLELENKVKEVRGKHQVIQELTQKKIGPVQVMESLSAATPPSLWLTEFKETGGNLTITGIAMDNQTIADFLKALATFAYFNRVELVEVAQAEQDGMTVKKFTVRSNLTYQPSPVAAGEKTERKPPVKEVK
jgi:type IV pilus assembly protein PilN